MEINNKFEELSSTELMDINAGIVAIAGFVIGAIAFGYATAYYVGYAIGKAQCSN